MTRRGWLFVVSIAAAAAFAAYAERGKVSVAGAVFFAVLAGMLLFFWFVDE